MRTYSGKAILKLGVIYLVILLCASCFREQLLTGPENQPVQSPPQELTPARGGPHHAGVERPQQEPASSEARALEKAGTQDGVERSDRLAALIKAEKAGAVAPVDRAGRVKEASTSPRTQELEASAPAEAHHPTPRAKKKTNQELLDSALEFCQASYDYWERGDLENAIESLDQAYSLILKVEPGQNSELLQQTEDLRITISKRILEVYSSRYIVANGYYKAIPLVMNRHVQDAINLLKGNEREFFLNAYHRSGAYRPAIVKALREAGLPEELSWLPLIESGFKVRALSRARALGLWQFIASTGYKYGLTRDRWIDERMDPEKSTAAAIAYLKELHQIFGDWTTVLAGYNCGEGRVLRVIRTQRINYLDHFWDLYEKLPVETAFYVPKFLAVLHILDNPKAFDFTLPPVDEGIEAETITIDRQIHLKAVAKELGVSFEILEGLNPALRRDSTPPTPYALKVPKGKGEVLLAKLDQIPVWHPPVSTYPMHRVRSGESLSVIARNYRTSVRAIASLNGLNSSNFIKAGWMLKIPTGREDVSLRETPVPVTPSVTGKKSEKYLVRKGDSLWKIAEHFGTTVKTIQSLNGLKTASLSVGDTLQIPTTSGPTKKSKTKTYKILKGDSPYLIAKKHQMDLSELLSLNNLTPRSTIFPGQLLLVKTE
ncbi:MAG: LysM peptidoglycan-binding domain-containing protein [Pseudomonadota bacterium]